MNTNFEKIKELILKSSIPAYEQDNLILLFAKAEDADLETVLELLSENPLLVSDMNDNYKAKHGASMTGDSELWKKIIEEEVKQLEGIES